MKSRGRRVDARSATGRVAAWSLALALLTATVHAIAGRAAIASSGSAIMLMSPGGTAWALTDGAANNVQPAWSPDGLQVVFASGSGHTSNLYLVSSGGGTPQALTSGAHADVQPAWSPDGSTIAFASNRAGNYDLYTIHPDGTGLHRVTTNAASDVQPAWSPDGSTIAFASNRAGNYDLYTIHPDGTGLQRLTSDVHADKQPSWSPSGGSLAFASNRNGSYDIFVKALGGAAVQETTGSKTDLHPAWSPDGTKLLFSRSPFGGSPSPSPSPSSTSPSPSPSPSPSSSPPPANTFYVSRNGDDTDGRSWATAWNSLAAIKWSEISAGSTILLDGGPTACASPYTFTGTRPGIDCGMEYDTALSVGASGTASNPVVIKLATDPGHDGTAVLFGGRTTPLPYCHQTGYTAKAVRQYGILVGDYHDVVIDGSHRGGIMVYGAVQGVRVSSQTASDLTFERMEVFDNGSIGTSSGGGAATDEEGFSLAGGRNTLIRGDLIHDNGQDEIQDETRSGNSLDGLTIDTSWLYASRENPAHPGEPFNDLQAVGDDTCTHADAVQLYSGGPDQSGLTVEHSILGPLVNQGLYPGDSSTGATWTDVTVSDSLLLAVSHNVISDNKVHDWTLDDDTLFAPQGGFEIPANGANAIQGVIKYGGYVYTPSWSGVTSGDDWWLGDSLPGSSSHTDPLFASTPSGTLPGWTQYQAANFTPACTGCTGSSIHTLHDVLARIDALP